MPEELILPVSSKNRKAWRYFAALGPVAALVIFFGSMVLAGVSLEEIPGLLRDGPGWFFGLPALLPLLLAYLGLVNLSDHLVFGESHFERRGLPHPSVFRGPVAYSEITQVWVGGFGMLILETSGGGRFRIYPRAFEGGRDPVLSELRARVAHDRFQPDLESALETKTRKDRLAPIIAVSAMGLVALSGWSDQIIDSVREDHAWTLEIDAESMDEAVEDFLLEEGGAIWLLIRRGGGYSDPGSYAVRRLSATGEETWGLPSKDVLFPEGVPEHVILHPREMALTDAGEPRLAFDVDLPHLRLSGGRWEWETEVKPKMPDPFAILAEKTGDSYWTSLEFQPGILARQAVSGAVEEVELGGQGQGFSLDYKVDYLGTMVARIGTQDRRYFFLPVLEGEQEKTWLEVDFRSVPLRGQWELLDYATDSTGVLYVLVRDETYCNSGKLASHLGRANPGGGGWQWWTVFQPGRCNDIFGEPRFIVDGNGRVWLPGWREVSVFPLEALLTGDASGIIHYTRYNSGLMGGRGLQVGPDGRIWTMDPLGDGLSWIDPSVDQLAGPLPAWIAALRENFWWRLTPAFAGMALMLGGLVWDRRDSSRRRFTRT